MTKIDHEKMNRTEKVRTRNRPSRYQRKGEVQMALAKFVAAHDLSCFKCGAVKAEWAKTGISKRGPWAICRHCVQAET